MNLNKRWVERQHRAGGTFLAMHTRLRHGRGNRVVIVGASLLIAVSMLVGCSPDAAFSLNSVYFRRTEQLQKGVTFPESHKTDIRDALFGLFGTPDDPFFPRLAEVDTSQIVDLQRIQFAAGPVGSNEAGDPRGLYREHCAHCHGISGDGAGPTAAFLNPYPRDYRLGVFKFKSTPKGERPTDSDLKRILVNGIPDTAMPSFKLLSDPELDALVDYVKYLAIRGEVERGLVEELNQLGEGERLVNTLLRDEDYDQYQVQIGAVTDIVTQVLRRWERAPSMVTPIPQNPVDEVPGGPEREEARSAAIARGRELFYGKFDCKKCHGESALGDGTTNDYDDWTKVWLEDPLNKTAEERDDLEEMYRQFGALPSRNIRPRNLRNGVYRGGRRPIDLFRRVRNGIDGTPMPGVAPAEPDEEVWAVVEYVRSLPYESISRPEHDLETEENLREIR